LIEILSIDGAALSGDGGYRCAGIAPKDRRAR